MVNIVYAAQFFASVGVWASSDLGAIHSVSVADILATIGFKAHIVHILSFRGLLEHLPPFVYDDGTSRVVA